MSETFPVLYILMRNDLKSMNPGKAMAQASHASNAFMNYAQTELKLQDDQDDAEIKTVLVSQWQRQTSQGFGTVLTLAVNETGMRTAVEVANTLGFIGAVVHDPTYPILIPVELGKALHTSGLKVPDGFNYLTIPLDTCAYVFGDKNDPMLEAVVGRFPLHP